MWAENNQYLFAISDLHTHDLIRAALTVIFTYAYLYIVAAMLICTIIRRFSPSGSSCSGRLWHSAVDKQPSQAWAVSKIRQVMTVVLDKMSLSWERHLSKASMYPHWVAFTLSSLASSRSDAASKHTVRKRGFGLRGLYLSRFGPLATLAFYDAAFVKL